MSQYVCHHKFSGKTISGFRTYERGDQLTEEAGMIKEGDANVCLARSQNGIEHFAINDDGLGIQRGDLTYAIAFSDRQKIWTEEVEGEDEQGNPITESVEMQARFSPEEAEMLVKDYSHWLRQGHAVILFNDDFFRAKYEDLKELAEKLELI